MIDDDTATPTPGSRLTPAPEASPEPTAAGVPPAEEKAAVWEDFIDIFYAPSAVFERRKGRSPWPILAVVTAALAALMFAWQGALEPVMSLEMQRAMAEGGAQGGMSAEQMEQMGSMTRLFGWLAFVVSFPVMAMLTGLAAWGLTRMFGAAATFTTALLVVAYAQIVRTAQYGLGLLQTMVVDIAGWDSIHDASFSLARFLDQPDAGATLVALAARVDLFTLWATALIAIGLAVQTRLSRTSAWAVAGIVWALAALPALLGSTIGG